MRFSEITLISVGFVVLIQFSSYADVNTKGEKGVVRAVSARTFGKASMNVGVGVGFQQSSDYFKGSVSGATVDPLIEGSDGSVYKYDGLEPARLLSSNLFFGISPLSFWDIAFTLPFYYDWSGLSRIHDGGLGDIEVSTKLAFPAVKKAFHQSYMISGTIPVGMKQNGIFPRNPYSSNNNTDFRLSFYSVNYPTIKPLLLLTYDFGSIFPSLPLQVHANLGGSLLLTWKDHRNTLIGAFALEYTPVSYLTIFSELYSESAINNFATSLTPRKDPVYFSPGLRINTPSGTYFQFAGDFSLSSKIVQDRINWSPKNGGAAGLNYSTSPIPEYGVQFTFGWSGSLVVQDDDKDGIKNELDRCPKEPEDIDGFEDTDGCPDLDNDNDGIPDLKDKCPNDPEDKDGFEDQDGCPDLDNDNDGIIDLKDQCPNVAEDFDGFEDRDGCPDYDNDKDGIPDSLDKCPNEAEDLDGFEDTDGCPDLDNDKDGIPDVKDKCPNEAEIVNGFQDDDGCPDTVKKEPDMPKQQIIRGLSFKNSSPEMTFESYANLDPVANQMRQYPEIEIEVRAYTDALGDRVKNQQVSQLRAEAVRQYLISKGVGAGRIRAVGLGPSNPIADNKTAAGRSQNRRIEIVRLK
jgi:outer membrane protein OmpA-like peptidoglycan-associated protein